MTERELARGAARRLAIIRHAQEVTGNVALTCRYYGPDYRSPMTHHLVGVAEIAEMLGVSRQRVNRMIQTIADFPAPEIELSAGRVWRRSRIERWMEKHPDRRPGRPRG